METRSVMPGRHVIRWFGLIAGVVLGFLAAAPGRGARRALPREGVRGARAGAAADLGKSCRLRLRSGAGASGAAGEAAASVGDFHAAEIAGAGKESCRHPAWSITAHDRRRCANDTANSPMVRGHLRQCVSDRCTDIPLVA